MDWIDEQVEKLRKWLIGMELKRSLAVYIFLAILGVLTATVLTGQICSSWMEIMNNPYVEKEMIGGYSRKMGRFFFYTEINPDLLPKKVKASLLILQLVMQFSVIPYTVFAVILVASLYYRNKLKEPIQRLIREADQISRNRLDVPCRYESGDEMGIVCNAVDGMRQRLAENQGKIWEQMEEQRRLNAAFAHDMRTPLTVLHGYVDLLLAYHGQGEISQKKMQEILEMMDGQLYRLEEYADTMKEIHVLDDRKPERKKVKLGEVKRRLAETVEILGHNRDICLEVTTAGAMDAELSVDLPMVQEVADNFISNALRYAENLVLLRLEYEEASRILRLYVQDDGRGFTGEELKMAVHAYYGEHKGEGGHYGIGLSICRTLCEKHGGSLTLSNSLRGGGIVCGEFQV